MQGGIDCRQEAVVGIQSEVHRDLCLGGHRSGNLDVEHDFPIGIRILSRQIGADAAVTSDTDRGDLRHRQPQRREVRLEVAKREPCRNRMRHTRDTGIEIVQFDDGDALTVAVQSGREVVQALRPRPA